MEQNENMTNSSHELKQSGYTKTKQEDQNPRTNSPFENNQLRDPSPILEKINIKDPSQLAVEQIRRRQLFEFEEESRKQQNDVLNPQTSPKLVGEEQINITILQLSPQQFAKPNVIQQREDLKQCIFCAEMLTQQNFKSVFHCEHLFCKNCLTLYFDNEIKNFRIVQCPSQQCGKTINQSSSFCNTLMMPHKQKYQIVQFRKNIQGQKNVMLCPNQNCKKGFMQVKQGQTTAKCVECQIIYCVNCKMECHEGKCQNFEQILLKDKFKYKRCYGCKRIVQRNQGCPHMTCKCGAQFCYHCGGIWKAPHRCLRCLAGGQLITDKLNRRLKCLRMQKLQYQYNFIGYFTRLPYYLVCLLIMLVYIAWCITVLTLMTTLIVTISSAIGYFIMICKGCKQFSNTIQCIFIMLCIFLLPVAFVVGIFVSIGMMMYSAFPKYLQLGLSGRLIPFC